MCAGDIHLIIIIAFHPVNTHDSGPEHSATASGPAQPSYCTLSLFHAPHRLDRPLAGGMGYVSNDGHAFACRNPAVMQQAFHV